MPRGLPGNGDRPSTCRYPLVSALSPVVSAPLTTSACARFVPRSDCYSSAPGANPQVSARKQAPDHSWRTRRLVPWVLPEHGGDSSAYASRSEPIQNVPPTPTPSLGRHRAWPGLAGLGAAGMSSRSRRGTGPSVVVLEVLAEPPDSPEIAGQPLVGQVGGRPWEVKAEGRLFDCSRTEGRQASPSPCLPELKE
jgi:hypothetical protein